MTEIDSTTRDEQIVKIEFNVKKPEVSKTEAEQILAELFQKLDVKCETDLCLIEYVIHVATRFVQKIKIHFTNSQSKLMSKLIMYAL